MRAQLGLALAVLAALALPAQPAAAQRKPLPQLAVSNVKYSPYGFKGESASKLSFCERTTNLGGGATSRRLHNRMVLQGYGAGAPVQVLAIRDVPKLPGVTHVTDRHGRSHTRRYSHYGCVSGDRAAIKLPPGAYDVFICADQKLKQKRHAKNCFDCTKCFFVIKRSWTGTANGTVTTAPGLGGATGNAAWQVPSVTYTFASAAGSSGRFTYNATGGSTNYQVSGSDDEGCTGAGGATYTVGNGKLVMDYSAGNYTIFGELPAGSSVSALITCPDHTLTQVTPAVIRVLSNGVEAGLTNALPFGQEVLSGAFQNASAGVVTYQDQWNLR